MNGKLIGYLVCAHCTMRTGHSRFFFKKTLKTICCSPQCSSYAESVYAIKIPKNQIKIPLMQFGDFSVVVFFLFELILISHQYKYGFSRSMFTELMGSSRNHVVNVKPFSYGHFASGGNTTPCKRNKNANEQSEKTILTYFVLFSRTFEHFQCI